MSENAKSYRRGCIKGAEGYVAAAQRSLERVETIHTMILQNKKVYAHDKPKRRSLLRLARQCVKGSKESLAVAKAEYERVVGLPLEEFE